MTRHESYGSDYYLDIHRNWFEVPNTPLFDELARELISRGSTSVLDVGCGNGDFLRYLAKKNQALILEGIDLSDAAQSSDGINFRQGNFLTFDFGRRFDAIVSLAVIEHVSEVMQFVARLHELLAPGGILIVMTVNERGLLYRISNVLRLIGMQAVDVRLYDAHHLNHFSQTSLVALLAGHGLFEIEKVINHNAPLASIDIPTSNLFTQTILKLGVGAIFLAGTLTRKTYLQTIIASKVR